MAARLKVFATSDGFTDYVVATSSRPKALAAWGVRQDLFKEGRAHETDDRALVAAATLQPGEVLRRPAGSRGELAKVKAAKPKARAPDPAHERRIAALKRRLSALEADQAKALLKLEAQRDALEAKIAALRTDQALALEALKAELSAARRARG